MKLWLLRPCKDLPPVDNLWERPYGVVQGVVVQAVNEQEARALAQAEGGMESWGHANGLPVAKPTWLDARYSTCVELTGEGPARVILRDEL